MKNILFVCTGNTCRSPMAEGFLKAMLQDTKHSEDYMVSSAGIYAYEGDSVSLKSVSVMGRDWGIDISGHKAAALTMESVANATLILTMTRRQKDEIISEYPSATGKVFTLKEYLNNEPPPNELQQYDYTLDIIDPYGYPEHYYSICAKEIRDSVENLLSKLENI